MKKKTIYEANDGEEFDSRADCKEYERKLKGTDADRIAAAFLKRSCEAGAVPSVDEIVRHIRANPEEARVALSPLMPVKRPRKATAEPKKPAVAVAAGQAA